jgi:hypothetical protein
MFNSRLLMGQLPTNIVVEYDGKGGRVRKSFAKYHESRRFYLAQSKAGKNPVIVSAQR